MNTPAEITTINPATGQHLARYTVHSDREVEEAVVRGHAVARGWARAVSEGTRP